MNLDKNFMRKTLQEVVKEFSEKILPVDGRIELQFVEKSGFIESAKKDMAMAMFIDRGVFTNFESEYPNFLVVYPADKEPIRRLMGLPFYISVCFEIAKEKAKGISAQDFREFLKHGFAHEMSHLFQEDIKKDKPEFWSNILSQSNGNTYLAHETMSESIADMIGDATKSDAVQNQLWSHVYSRARKLGLSK